VRKRLKMNKDICNKCPYECELVSVYWTVNKTFYELRCVNQDYEIVNYDYISPILGKSIDKQLKKGICLKDTKDFVLLEPIKGCLHYEEQLIDFFNQREGEESNE